MIYHVVVKSHATPALTSPGGDFRSSRVALGCDQVWGGRVLDLI